MFSPDYVHSLIIYEDEAFLAVNKPSGLLTIPDGYHPDLPHLGKILYPVYGKTWIVHRLDRETSGVILVARNQDAHRAINGQFQQRLVEKRYHALILGTPSWSKMTIDTPLQVNGDRRHRTIPAPLTGKKAKTEVFLREKYELASLIEAHPLTGYTHQIRAHLASIGFPVLGDRLYATLHTSSGSPKPKDDLVWPMVIDRVALHAFSITFQHPVTKDRLTLSAGYPDDFSRAIDALLPK